jgi:AbrB family looped-hinge helix DNA binding protein
MATISSKFQVVIPKDVREKLRLKTGQKMEVVAKGDIIYMVPDRPLESLRGFLQGMSTKYLREDQDS